MSRYSEEAFKERQQLAWLVLLGSFAICMIITVAVPVGVNAALQNMKQSLTTLVQANQGTVRVETAGGGSRVILAGEPGLTVEGEYQILTDETATALLLVYPPDTQEQPLARLQIYSRSGIGVTTATAPRFSVSDEAQNLALLLENGRFQLDIPVNGPRPFVTTINTPHGSIFINAPGQYALLVEENGTQVSVHDGAVDLLAMSQALRLDAGQRGEILDGRAPNGPLQTARDLVRNGNFDHSWADWSLYVWNVELADQPQGTSEIVEVSGEPAVQFTRQGVGHADVRLRQSIEQDVTDYETLPLRLTFQIVDHDLGVCGIQGSECPLFVRITYTDDRGVSRIWQHGFYANGDVSPLTTPDACVSCAVIQDTHQRVPAGQITFYETDLLAELARQGAPRPTFIEDISLISSGHSFQVQILDVALVVEE
jgi:hypothetical protein